ncbi:MAG TPA: NmrA family NAD(P)-binding protein [Leptolyngbyaceae cyanobacterium M33_DOE_097]|uniref:NmrA/HSCARG family protein n=1 Tax=Oscillatoriales cyanobacterium SpSt-418 TaxID=2282169 RepID=A0A7C3KG35_9CYAN|nr:NmrA family NAD(P)-binding protein [Leptolyngbyaceae cyanobacterium M33_DOE_097]
MEEVRSSPNQTEISAGKVLLIGVTGGTGGNVVKGFCEQSVTALRAITRKIDLNRPAHADLQQAGVELVEADLDDVEALKAAFDGVDRVYCHAFAGDHAKPEPQELSRAEQLAKIAQSFNIQHFVYNSAGGAERHSGIPHIEQKYKIEQILNQTGLPTTMLRACLFMEEFWKPYTRPSILKGTFPFSVQRDKPLHLITTKDLGRVAAYVMQHPTNYLGRAIELAGDVLTPTQMAEAFSHAQGRPVVHQEIPPWIFLLLFRKSLYDLIQWYRKHGYEADVEQLNVEFPGLLTSFSTFLEETQWANPEKVSV